MSTKLVPAVILAIALGHVACSQTSTRRCRRSRRSGQPGHRNVHRNADAERRRHSPVQRVAVGSASGRDIARLEPGRRPVTIGLSLGTWNGAACQTVISNDSRDGEHGQSIGAVDRAGRLCVRAYDAAGTLPQATNYELTVVRP